MNFVFRYFGRFNPRSPFFTITDLELIKRIGVKDFLNFPNHSIIIDPEDEPLFGRSLFMLKDQEWKDMRATLSPAFTGNKLRQMLPLISKCCHNGCDYLKEEAARDGQVDMDINEFFIKFTIDMIATTAFGVEVNSLKDKDNEFYKISKGVVQNSFLTTMRMLLAVVCPKLMRVSVRIFLTQSLYSYFNFGSLSFTVPWNFRN